MRGLLRRLVSGLRVLTHRAAADRDIADEVDHFFAEAVAALLAEGHSPAEARRRARLRLGERAHVREHMRSFGWETTVELALADVRQALRMLRRSPGFAAAAVLTLGLGIGASTAVFSAASPMLLEPLPYPESTRIVAVWDRSGDGGRLEVTFGTYREVAERTRTFAALAVTREWRPALAGGHAPERIEAQRVSAEYFRVLGIPPAVGRDFAAFDDGPGAAPVAVVSDALGRRHFGGGQVVGRRILLDGVPHTVIGVMPAGFENVLAPRAELWAALQYDPALPVDGREWGHHLRMAGRLSIASTLDATRAELEGLARTPTDPFPRPAWASLENGLHVEPLRNDLTRMARPALLAVSAAALLLLLLACVNVAGLLLARAAQRRPELALRTVLGAGRGRLGAQLVTESLILAAFGGLAGLALAVAGVSWLRSRVPPELPRAAAIHVDAGVLAFTLGVTVIVGLGIGVLSAGQAARRMPDADLRHGSRRLAGGRLRTRRVMVVAQVLLAVMLLAHGGLLLRSLQRLFAVDTGFTTDGLLTMQVEVSGDRYADDAAVHRFFDQALKAVRDVPGVEAAAFASQLPLSGNGDLYGIRFESASLDDRWTGAALRYAVSHDFFRAMGIPLRSGRTLNQTDNATSPHTAVISASLARRRFGAADPVGQRLRLGPDDRPWTTVVGVAGDVRHTSLAIGAEDIVYVAEAQGWFADRVRWLVVRAGEDPETLTAAVRGAIWSVDAERALGGVSTMRSRVAGSVAERRFTLLVFETFGTCALLLAGIGLYGVLASSVAERTREIGVRSALGASRGALLRLVAGQGLALAGAGATAGLVAALATTRSIRALLFGVTPLDPTTWAGVLLTLLTVAAAAVAVPAWRAARIDPGTALRAD